MDAQANGSEPQESVLLTREMLHELTTHRFVLEGLSKRHSAKLGRPVEVALVCREVSTLERNTFLPELPGEAADWGDDEEEFRKNENAWLKTLSPEEIAGRRAANRDVPYRVLHLALLDPKLSYDEVRALGDDAVAASVELQVRCGLMERTKPKAIKTQSGQDVDTGAAEPAVPATTEATTDVPAEAVAETAPASAS